MNSGDNSIKQDALAMSDELIRYRRHIHQHPEIGLELKNTRKFVKQQLEMMGYDPVELGAAGLVALAGGKREGKTFLLRADMDALPIREETELDFKSQNDFMHACGHDLHTAALLGAAKLLKEREDEIRGRVKLMFQPGEEIFAGARDMIAAGVLQNPSVDGAMMIHVLSKAPVPAGSILFLNDGPALTSNDAFDITVHGVGCHGAMPSTGVDPFVAASHIHQGIMTLNSREIPADEMMVASVGAMNGGKEFNIIPNTVTMKGTLRSYKEDIRNFTKKRIRELAEHISAAYRCTATLEYYRSTPSLLNNADLNREVRSYCEELFQGDVQGPETSGLARLSPSEDFGLISRAVPSVVVLVSTNVEGAEQYPMHHSKVEFDESVIPRASAIYAHTALRWLQEH